MNSHISVNTQHSHYCLLNSHWTYDLWIISKQDSQGQNPREKNYYKKNVHKANSRYFVLNFFILSVEQVSLSLQGGSPPFQNTFTILLAHKLETCDNTNSVLPA